VATHQFLQSQFHRSVDFCGTCHDVSNPVVGDLEAWLHTGMAAPYTMASASTALPEPDAVLSLAAGIAFLAAIGRRRARRAAASAG
jgi:hypothetical protein